MKKLNSRRLHLSTQTIAVLTTGSLRNVRGGWTPNSGPTFTYTSPPTTDTSRFCPTATSPTTHSQADSTCTLGTITCPSK